MFPSDGRHAALSFKVRDTAPHCAIPKASPGMITPSNIFSNPAVQLVFSCDNVAMGLVTSYFILKYLCNVTNIDDMSLGAG